MLRHGTFSRVELYDVRLRASVKGHEGTRLVSVIPEPLPSWLDILRVEDLPAQLGNPRRRREAG